jgi:UDP-galactose transporter B1
MSFAMSFGLAFAIATLAKSAKMAPVMAGGIFIGGKKYPLRQYFQVAAIIMATVLVSMSSKKSGSGTTTTISGFVFICLSLMFDGLTGGVQDRVKAKCKENDVKVKPFDMMFWTNFFMLLVAIVFAFVTPTAAGSVQMLEGIGFIMSNPAIMSKILAFAACSALGQCFIFFVVANFGALKCSTVTTTRKIFSVLWSIFTKGYVLAPLGYFGILVGSLGIIGELIPEKPEQEKRQVAPVQPAQAQVDSELATSKSNVDAGDCHPVVIAAQENSKATPMLAKSDGNKA